MRLFREVHSTHTTTTFCIYITQHSLTCWLFCGGRKTGEPGEKPTWHRREQHIKQTQLTYDPAQAGARTRDLRGERPVDKPLSHPCHPCHHIVTNIVVTTSSNHNNKDQTISFLMCLYFQHTGHAYIILHMLYDNIS